MDIRELSIEETLAVAGGNEDVPICGTPWRKPGPPQPWFNFNPIQISPIQVVIGHG